MVVREEQYLEAALGKIEAEGFVCVEESMPIRCGGAGVFEAKSWRRIMKDGVVTMDVESASRGFVLGKRKMASYILLHHTSEPQVAPAAEAKAFNKS